MSLFVSQVYVRGRQRKAVEAILYTKLPKGKLNVVFNVDTDTKSSLKHMFNAAPMDMPNDMRWCNKRGLKRIGKPQQLGA